ncbi:MAG: hypothetical protein IT353_11130 [Gemmatimonadaceae bacterium]|nr:hypothetical protein [Gemmatimonadaceae bacterium]
MADTSRVIHALAAVLTPSRVQPFLPPARPFVVGGAESLGMHQDYCAQHPVPSVPRAPSRALLEIAEQLVREGVVHKIVVARMSPEGRMELEMPKHASCVLCADILHRLADPSVALRSLRQALAPSDAEGVRVGLISVPLREMPLRGDVLGPPHDVELARMWTFPELVACVEAFGLMPLFGGICEGNGLVVVAS